MFDITNVTVLYTDLLFSAFSVIILAAALVCIPVGIWALKTVKKNAWAAGISAILLLLSLIGICVKKINLRGLMCLTVSADIFLGAAAGFLVAILVIKYRHGKNKV